MRPAIRSGRPAVRVEALDRSVVDRQHMVDDRLLEEELLHRLELLRVLRGDVMRKAEVLASVVELPVIFGRGWRGLIFPRRLVNGAGEPSVVVDGAIAEDFEILRQMAVRRLRIVERIDHADALDRGLRRTVDA